MSYQSGWAFQPALAVWEVTRACDRGCLRPHAGPELRTSEALALVAQLVELAPRLVVLTGDDPLQRPGLDDLVAALAGGGLRVVTVLPATPLLGSRRLERLAAAGLGGVSLALDGPDAATHDARRGTGSFAATRAALDASRDAGLAVGITTRLTRDTVDHLARTAALVEATAPASWNVDFVVPSGRHAGERGLAPDAYERVLAFLCEWRHLTHVPVTTTAAPAFRRVCIRRAARAGHPLPAAAWRPALNDGRGIVFVSHAGDIQPSEALPLSTANVRETSVATAYRRSRLFRALRDPSRLEGRCGACAFRRVCGGSRARAFAETGNFLAADPACGHRLRAAA